MNTQTTVHKPTRLEYWGETKLRYWVESLMHRAGTYGHSYRLIDVDGTRLLGFMTASDDVVRVYRLKA